MVATSRLMTKTTPQNPRDYGFCGSQRTGSYAEQSEWFAAIWRLADPVPREHGALSWHPEAIRALRERRDRPGRLAVYVILFWIPRDMVTMPSVTTNIE
ncbi:hypothetical protein GCM10029992_32630 [Glycomyces albus]